MRISPPNRPRFWSWIIDGLLLFLAATALVRPLYKNEYLDAWNSIESTFISDGRFLSTHWPHPGWQPNWYGGTRTDYIYPPALRYGTAVLSRIRHVSTGRSYHLFIALLYSLGIAGVYVFVRAGSGSRWIALWTAVASAVVSPAFLLFKDFRIDYAGVQFMPVRLGALIRYGEGPHMSAFALLPFALAAAWRGLRRDHRPELAISAVFAALTVAHNFYGATALAIFFPIVAWSVWLAEQDRLVWVRAAAVAAMAWGLCAFWLTPSFLRITLANMSLVSEAGHVWSGVLGAAAVAVYAAISFRLSRGRPERAWATFCVGAFGLMGLNVMGNQYYDFRVIGEPGRLIPELELAIFLMAGLLFGLLARRGRWQRAAAVVLAVACLIPGAGYVQHAWKVMPPRDTHEHRIEYVLTKWVHANLPGVRTLATGSVRFWYNAWYDMPQLGGGSEQGELNRNVQYAYGNALSNDDPAQSIAWMQAAGVGAVIVHDKKSTEVYHDWAKPEKFEGILTAVYDDHAGNRIYRVPRRDEALARVVDAARIRGIRATGQTYEAKELDQASVARYVEAVERGPAPALELRRISTDEMGIRTRLEPGQLLLVQETYDPAWRAYSGGRSIPIESDPLGFLLLDPGPGRSRCAAAVRNAVGESRGPVDFRFNAAGGGMAAVRMD